MFCGAFQDQDGLPSAKAKCGCVPLPRLASAKVGRAWLGLLPLHENRKLFRRSYSRVNPPEKQKKLQSESKK